MDYKFIEKFKSVMGIAFPRDDIREFSGRNASLRKNFERVNEQLNKFNELDYYERLDREKSHKLLLSEMEEIKNEAIQIDKDIKSFLEQKELDKENAIAEIKDILKSDEFLELCKGFEKTSEMVRRILELNKLDGINILKNAGIISTLARKDILRGIFNPKMLKFYGIDKVAGVKVDEINSF